MNQELVINNLRTLYDLTPKVWRTFRGDGIDGKPEPRIDMPLDDGMTPGQHLDAATEKSSRPFRFAVVGAFSTGKSTLLNALVHQSDFSEKLKNIFDLNLANGQKLLSTGQQVTTGNIIELEFSGDQFSGCDPSKFEFSVHYLSQRELKELVNYYCSKLNINIVPDSNDFPNWIQNAIRLKGSIRTQYIAINVDQNTKKNLFDFYELLESLTNPNTQNIIGPVSHSRTLQSDPNGFSEFQRLQTKRPITLPSDLMTHTFAPTDFEFCLIKSLRFKFPHPDFEGTNFSIFDFPGLGSGNRRDDFISTKFIPESNIILMPYLSTAVGGQAVTHILEVFSRSKPNMTKEDLLKRIYFIISNHPRKAPNGPTLKEFFQEFFQPVANTMHLIIQNEPESIQKDLYKKYLDHYIGCDGYLGGIIRDGAHINNSNNIFKAFTDCQSQGCFNIPNSDQLAGLSNTGNNFNISRSLSDILTDSTIISSIQKIFKTFETDGGIKNFINVIKNLINTNAGRSIVEDDIKNHLESSAKPFSDLFYFFKSQKQNHGNHISITNLIQDFDEAVNHISNLRTIFEHWGNFENIEKLNLQNSSKDKLKELEKIRSEFEQKLIEEIKQSATIENYNIFHSNLRVISNIEDWIADGAPPEESFFGDEELVDNQGLIQCNHSLVVYHFFLKIREEIYEKLKNKYCEEFNSSIIDLLANEFKVWENVSVIFRKIETLLENKKNDLQGDVSRFEQIWKNNYLIFFKNPQSIDGISTLKKFNFFKSTNKLTKNTSLEFFNPADIGGFLPSTGNQLKVFLKRINFSRFKDDGYNANINFPENDPLFISQILKGLGFDDNQISGNSANPNDDYKSLPLPKLTSLSISRITDQGNANLRQKVCWNPIPFNPLIGDLGYNQISNLIGDIESYLVNLFLPLAINFFNNQKVTFDMFLKDFSKFSDDLLKKNNDSSKYFWDWIQKNNAEICDKTTDEATKTQICELLAKLKMFF